MCHALIVQNAIEETFRVLSFICCLGLEYGLFLCVCAGMASVRSNLNCWS